MLPTLAYTWRWALPMNQVIGVAIVLAALAVAVYWRSMRHRPGAGLGLLAMRLATIAALAALLGGVSEQPPATPATGKPPLYIYLDTSRSMLTADVQGEPRIAFVARRWLSDEQLARLREAYDVQLFSFDASSRPLSPGALDQPADDLAAGGVSNIADVLRDAALNAVPRHQQAAMLVLSDGHDTAAEPFTAAAAVARARRLPIHAVCLGGRTLTRDLRVVASLQQKYLIAKEPGRIKVTVGQVGLPDASTTLHVRRDGEDTTRPVNFNGRDSAELLIPVQHDASGTFEYTINVDPAAGETETRNNTQSVFVEVTAEPIKVLVLEGEPYWDTKYLAGSLRKDGGVAVYQITQVSPDRQQRIGTRVPEGDSVIVPTERQHWAKFSVVILGRGIERMLTVAQAQQLAAYVRDGGGNVVFARGRAYDAGGADGRQIGDILRPIEPVVWGDGVVTDRSLRLTPAGRAAAAFTFELPGVNAADAVAALKAFRLMPTIERQGVTTIVWARAVPHDAPRDVDIADAQPAIVQARVGAGSVVAILGEGMWQWANLPPRLSQYDGLYDAFWSNLVRGLAMGDAFKPNEQVSLDVQSDNLRLRDVQLLTVEARFEPAGGVQPQLRITDPAGEVHQPALRRLIGGRRWRAEFTPMETGVYTVQLDASPLDPPRIEKKFNVYDEDLERLYASADPEAMRLLAEQSGGLVLSPDQPDELPAQLARLAASRVTPHEPKYIWNRGVILAVLLLWVGAEWLLRRTVGLI